MNVNFNFIFVPRMPDGVLCYSIVKDASLGLLLLLKRHERLFQA
jgi:hypothetical protein